MTGEWFTYRQAAELLNASPEAVRQRARRGGWQRTLGNDKRTRIRPPDGWLDHPPVRPHNRPNGQAQPDARVIKALEAHVGALEAHVGTLQAHIETLKSQLNAAELRAAKQAVDFAAREARAAADFTVERTLADQMSGRVDKLTAELAAEQAERERAEKELAAYLSHRWWRPSRS